MILISIVTQTFSINILRLYWSKSEAREAIELKSRVRLRE